MKNEKSSLLEKDSYTKELKYILTHLNHPNIEKILHVDILPNQKMLVKIQEYRDNGSIRDLIHGNDVSRIYYLVSFITLQQKIHLQ